MKRAAPLALTVLLAFAASSADAADAPRAKPADGPKELLRPADKKAAKPTGKLTYKLAGGSEGWDAKSRDRIVASMDAAVALYNENGTFDKALTAAHSPGTPTADGNINGSIRFGGQNNTRTALHEIAHTLGVGTHPKWKELLKDGKWTGQYALRQLRAFDGPDAELHGDRQHFWPYGLNQDREGGGDNFVRHVKMVAAIRADLGIGPVPIIAAPAAKPAAAKGKPAR